MNQNITIAINREYGSGGKTIGEMLAKELGISFYDRREIVTLASEESGINETLFNQAASEFKGRPIFGGTDVYTGTLLPPDHKDFTSPKNLFAYQAHVIQSLNEKESCVIVGHGGGYILKNRPNVLRVFVHAPEDFLMEQASLRIALSGRDLERFVEKENRRRADYNYYYTGEKWEDAHHYDLCLDSSKLGFEKCVDMIKGYMQIRFDGLEL